MQQSIKKYLAGATLALAAIAAAPAGAQPATSYVGVHAGAHDLDRWPATVNFGGPAAAGEVRLDERGHFGVLGGRQYGANRFELEYQRGRFAVTGASLGPVAGPAGGSGHYDVLTLGAYRVFSLGSRVGAFAGAALGAATVRLPQAGFPGCNCFPAARSSGWAGQVRAGAEFDLGSGHLIFAHYSWLTLPGPGQGGTTSVAYDRQHANVLGVGYRKAF